MKFSCEKNLLVSAISVASRTVAMKSAIPALEGIYIRAGVKVMLSGYNLETGITVGVDAEIRETGEAIFPARLFFDIVRKLPDDTVEVSVDENFKVSIRGGISSFSITAMSAEDYPELPDVESEKGVMLPQKQLKEMISGTIFAVSENQARPIHTGCLFEVADDGITVIAVDGYRLALRRWTPEGGVGRQMKFVAPAAALKEVEKILTDSDDAGFRIRNFVADLAGRDNVLHAYLPEFSGKEPRKAHPGRAGLLGVEGAPHEAVEQALADALREEPRLAAGQEFAPQRRIEVFDLYEDGLNGCAGAKERRARFLRYIDLPSRLSTNALLALLNRLFGFEEYKKRLARFDSENPAV